MTASRYPAASRTRPPTGNHTLSLSAERWTARFLPEWTYVALGAGGRSVTFTQLEAGGYGIDGEAIASGHTHTAPNGNHLLPMADGDWTAVFDPISLEVPFGRAATASRFCGWRPAATAWPAT